MADRLRSRHLEHLRSELERQARRRIRDESDVEELAQEVIFRCLAHRPEEEGTILPYARAVLANLIRRRWQRRQWSVSVEELAERNEASSCETCESRALKFIERGFRAFDDADLIELLRARIVLLPPHIRVVCEPHWIEGVSYRELAQRLGLDETTARVRCHKGRRLLLRDPLVQLALGGEISRPPLKGGPVASDPRASRAGGGAPAARRSDSGDRGPAPGAPAPPD